MKFAEVVAGKMPLIAWRWVDIMCLMSFSASLTELGVFEIENQQAGTWVASRLHPNSVCSTMNRLCVKWWLLTKMTIASASFVCISLINTQQPHNISRTSVTIHLWKFTLDETPHCNHHVAIKCHKTINILRANFVDGIDYWICNSSSVLFHTAGIDDYSENRIMVMHFVSEIHHIIFPDVYDPSELRATWWTFLDSTCNSCLFKKSKKSLISCWLTVLNEIPVNFES